jgi:hypothetical protein
MGMSYNNMHLPLPVRTHQQASVLGTARQEQRMVKVDFTIYKQQHQGFF